MPDAVIVERDGAVAIVRLNLPSKRNALVPELVTALTAVLDQVAADRSVRAVVLTGSGGAFCVGGDLGSMDGNDPLGVTAMMRSCQGIVRRLVAMPQPVVAVKSVLAAWPQSLGDVLRAEEGGQALLMGTADHGAARNAFFAKGTARFEGR